MMQFDDQTSLSRVRDDLMRGAVEPDWPHYTAYAIGSLRRLLTTSDRLNAQEWSDAIRAALAIKERFEGSASAFLPAEWVDGCFYALVGALNHLTSAPSVRDLAEPASVHRLHARLHILENACWAAAGVLDLERSGPSTDHPEPRQRFALSDQRSFDARG